MTDERVQREDPLPAAAFVPPALLAKVSPEVRAAIEAGTTEELLPLRDDPAVIAEQVREYQRATRARVWETTIADGWPAYRAATVEALSPAQSPARLAAWLSRPADAPVGRMLVLAGTTGAGKTYAAFALGNFAAAQGLAVRAWSHRGYLAALSVDDDREADWLIRKRARDAGLLILDDFGAELRTDAPASEHKTTETCELLSSRLAAFGKTIITTNLPSSALAVMFGGRIVSRLFEATVVSVKGEDRRRPSNLEW